MPLQTVILLLVLGFIQQTAHPSPSIQQPGKDEVSAAIQRLFSADYEDRLAATENIIRLGPQAVKPLLSLLEEVTRMNGRQYVSGKEKEGAKAYRRFLEMDRNNDPEGLEKAKEEHSKLDITSRLKEDIIYLLGELKSEEALPVLIDWMWHAPYEVTVFSGSGKPRWNDAMKALVRMGGVAVPSLIETLERAESIANSVEYNNVPLPDGAVRTIQDQAEENKRRIQTRAVLVLGEIGDERALPALERMLEKGSDRLEIREDYVRDAIEKIRGKAKEPSKSV
jgi:HEAT repeat protein